MSAEGFLVHCAFLDARQLKGHTNLAPVRLKTFLLLICLAGDAVEEALLLVVEDRRLRLLALLL